MDRYFKEKSQQGITIEKKELHIIGLVAVFIASKFEDVIPM